MTTNRPEFKAHDDFIFEHKKIGKVTREEFIKYIRSSHDHMRKLSQIIQQYDQTIDEYLNEWDGRLESFDEDVKDLLGRWIDDGTMDHIINENLMSIKADKEYVDELHDSTTAQLAQTEEQVIKQAKRDTSLNSTRRNVPLVSFVDDDGNPDILTKLVPLSQKYGVPFTVCAPSDFIKDGRSLNAEQLKNLQDNHGFEIASHAKTHQPINNTMTIDQQFIEVYESWRDMREMGLNVDTLVYPYGQATDLARDIASRFYKAGVSTDAYINNTPLRTYMLGRIDFPIEGWTLEDYKAKIDEAIANNSWLIFMMHCGQPKHDDTAQQMLEQLIQYIQSVSVDIVNVSDGIDIAGNVIDINQQEVYYAKDGNNNIRETVYHRMNPQTGVEKHNGLSKLGEFPEHKLSVDPVVGPTSQQSFPTLNSRGTLITVNNGNNFQATQLFVGRRHMFARSTSGNGGEWDNWRTVLLGIEKQVSADFGTLEQGQRKQVVISVPEMVAGNFVMLTPTTNMLSNIDFSYLNAGGGNLRVTLTNYRSDSQTIGNLSFNLFLYTY